ncbi:hypothetical protein FSP39_011104 [Pinctada imbricata]|uniref:Carboxylic ester hydrolase n=1 Tax=Pinctada imbricata TaxID=66713 RepID=A0AA88YUQ9_PINIB|nr:hypothetical protein FSP39_011104 [Pinctada imbricata]
MTTDFLCSYVANSVSTTFKGNKNALTKRICDIYSNNASVAAQSNAIVDIYSDFDFTMPAFSSADFHLSGMNSKTYMFLLTRANQMQISILPERTFPWTDQAVHAMELFYLFSPDDLFVALNQTEDIELGHKMQQYWSNFAKTSNPNGPDLPFWPQYDHQRRIQVLDVQIKTETDIYPDRMKLWMDTAQKEDIILQTGLGSLLGKKRFVSGLGTIYEFLNVPFAKPPIGSLRFRKPEPYGSWQGTLNATQYGPSCMQDKLGLPSGLGNQDVSEDCLHLNIYVPYRLSNESSHAKSVMVWVHGGGYSGGQGSFYDGTSLALRGDVIVVTINYRLGPFGFFSTNDSASPGNYGLWDQHLAFKWVHDNIATFGGDPGSVTIFGESAGGGSRFTDKSSYVKPIAANYISFHNCSSSNTSISVECLRNISAEELLNGGTFTPVIDGEFVIGYAEDVMQNRNSDIYRFYTSIDYMSGILDGDGAITMVYVITEPVLNFFNLSMATGLTTDILCGYVANYISESLYRNKSDVAKGVCDLYSNTTSVVAQSNAIVDLFSDVTFTMPALMSSDLRPSGGNAKRTYMFMMPRVNPRQQVLYPSWTYSWTDRAVHAMDLFYLFSPDDLLVTFNQTEDIELGHKMQQYWSNFAKTR